MPSGEIKRRRNAAYKKGFADGVASVSSPVNRLPGESEAGKDVEPIAYAYYWPDGGLMDVLLTAVAPHATLRQVPLYPLQTREEG